MSKYIVDLSEWQVPAKINYDRLANQLNLAILRVQYGSNYQDRHLFSHYQELTRRKIPLNVYAWVRGISVADMRQEARDFKARSDRLRPQFSCYWLDVEEQSMPDMRAGVTAFCQELRRLGAKKVGVYVAHHLYQSFNLDLSQFDAVWLPHYGINNGRVTSQPLYSSDLHQYTSRGRLDGYQGDLDLNRLSGSRRLAYFITPNVAPNELILNLGIGDRITVKQTATHWRDGETIAPWVRGRQFIIQGVQTYAKSYSQKAYRLGPNRDGETTGYMLAENIVETQILNQVEREGRQLPKIHRVKQGETLWSIAQHYGVSFKDILASNHPQIKQPDLIYPGQEIVVHK